MRSMTIHHGLRPAALRRPTLLGFVLLACAFAAAAGIAADLEATTLERRVKAAFLFKFAGFVDWPEAAFARPEAPFTMAVAGDEQVAAELSQAVAGRTIEGRGVAVRRLRDGDALGGVQLLFVARGESARLTQWIRMAQGRPILVVTETEGALGHGSMINFILAEGRVRFEISLASADRSGLVLSSRLLAVAHTVRPKVP